MTTLVLSTPTDSQQRVQILPRQTISSITDLSSFHPSLENVSFPKDIFDFEDIVQADDPMADLGMNPPTNTEYDAIPYFSNSNNDHTINGICDSHQALQTSDNDAETFSNSNDHTVNGISDSHQALQTSSNDAETFSNSNDHTVNGISDSHQALETNSSDAETSPGSVLPMSSFEAPTFTPSGNVVRTVSFPSFPSSVPNPIQDFAQVEPFTAVSPRKAYAPLLPNVTPTTTKPTLSTFTATNNLTTTTAGRITSEVTIAKSSSIPSLLPSDCLPKTSPSTAAAITTRVPPATATAVRKRKLSRKEAELNMSSEELEERRERNRSHAKKSRQRKKALTEILQESVQALQEENQKLRKSLNAQMGPQHAERWWQGQKDIEKESFLRALKNPENRIVDAAGLAFLRKLPSRLPKHDNYNNKSEAPDDAIATISAN